MYLKVDVLLLICVFQTFKKEFVNFFELDSAHYFSTPGYSWNAMLRFTGTNLKLISDIEKYELIKSSIRSGISLICKGYTETANKCLKSSDANEPTSHIKY